MPSAVSMTCIEFKVESQVGYVTLNRPESMNALSQTMVSELIEVFEAFGRNTNSPEHFDKDVRAIVLQGAKGNFCGGGDVKEMSALIEKSQKGELNEIAEYNYSAGRLFSAVANAQVPVIAVVEGIALGGGLGLACAADITVAEVEAMFGLPETSLGLLPAQVAPFIRRRVGESNARLLAVLGGKFDATRAARFGIVHYLVSTEEISETVSELIKKIKACAPGASALAKALMVETDPLCTNDPHELAKLFAEQMISDEGQEGTKAFVEKRKPNWNRI